MHTITNNYRDAHILNLSSAGERGPYLVTQTGVSPNDPLPKERMFVLRPDGRWVDFNAYACQGRPEAIDEIVFSSINEVMETFGKLFGRPQVLDLPVDEAGLRAGLNARKVAIHCKRLATGRQDTRNVTAKSVGQNESTLMGNKIAATKDTAAHLEATGS